MNDILGTPYYVSPEVLKGEYSNKCDIWSLGVCMYVLLCGYAPFPGKRREQIFNNIKSGKYDFHHDEWNNVSDECKALIEKMLKLDPNDRPTINEILCDKWFKTN